MESNNTLKNEQSVEECEETLKGPSFTLMYVLLIALFSFILISMYSLNQLAHIEKERTNQVSEIKNALANLETLPDKLYTAEGEKKNLSVTIEYPKIFVDQEDYLGTIIPIIQEQNAQAYEKLSSNLTLFSIVIALFSLALPIFSYTFIQRDQLRNINAQHYRLKRDALQRFKELEDKNNDLKNTLMKTVSEEIEKLKKEINQAQEVTSSVIPNPIRDDKIEISPTSDTNEDRSRAMFLSAKLNLNNGNYYKALSQINKAIELTPLNAEQYSIKSTILVHMRLFNEAYEAANKAYVLDSNNARYSELLGSCLNALRRFDDAISSKTQAIKLEPQNPYNYTSRAITYSIMKEYGKALDDAKTAIKMKNDDADCLMTYCWMLYKNKEYDEAQKIYNENRMLIHDRRENRLRALLKLKILLAEGETPTIQQEKEIIDDINSELCDNEENVYSYIYRAEVLILLSKFDEAFDSLKQALYIDDNEPEVYHWLAEYYRAIGDDENATLNDRLADEKGYIPEPAE